ncbi:MAG: DNA repair protein RadA, partial [Caulobacter sp. 39-67-4]
MARDGAVYACQSCGAVQTKWSGQCPACQSWNTLVEEVGARAPGALSVTKATRTRGLQFTDLESDTPAPPRIITGVDEFDRVCGGGVVPGSAILIGGDPGVGKSTLLLEVVARASMKGVSCAYISGEEAVAQIRGRAHRMGFEKAPVKLAAESSLRDILDGLKRDSFDLVV